jgi:hypothetical protein
LRGIAILPMTGSYFRLGPPHPAARRPFDLSL